MKITLELLERYGYTPNCDGCRFRRLGGSDVRPHTEVCRARIEEAMKASEEGRAHLEAQQARVDRRMAERSMEDDGPGLGPGSSGGREAGQSEPPEIGAEIPPPLGKEKVVEGVPNGSSEGPGSTPLCRGGSER